MDDESSIPNEKPPSCGSGMQSHDTMVAKGKEHEQEETHGGWRYSLQLLEKKATAACGEARKLACI